MDSKGATREKSKEAGDIYAIIKQRESYDEVVVINRPPCIQALTGLLVTTSAFTQTAGSLTFGASLTAENSKTPDYSVYQIPVTLTYGVSESIELGLKGKALATENVSAPGRERGAGDTEVLAKWRFVDQSVTFPALALGNENPGACLVRSADTG
jgi:hypothetical protein